MKKLLLILITFTFFISNKISAQYTEIINSNRPGDSQSAFSVGSNVIQIETGAYLLNEKHEILDNKVIVFKKRKRQNFYRSFHFNTKI